MSDYVIKYPVAEEKGEYTGEGEDPPEDCSGIGLTLLELQVRPDRDMIRRPQCRIVCSRLVETKATA